MINKKSRLELLKTSKNINEKIFETSPELKEAFKPLKILFKKIIDDEKKTDIILNLLLNEINDIQDYINKINNLGKKLEEIEPIANSKLKTKLKNFEFINFETAKKTVDEIENSINYMVIHENNEMNNISNSLGKFNRKDTCIIDIYTNTGTIKTNTLEYEIRNFEKLKESISITTSKLLIYAVHKLNFYNNISIFTFKEYAETRGIGKNQVNRNKLQKDLELLKEIGSIKYKNKKNDHMILDDLIYRAEYKSGKITLKFNPEFTQGLKNTYMYFPKSLMRLNGTEYRNVFLLGWYIFTQLRINYTNTLIRSIDKCLKQVTIPLEENIKNREYKKLIIEPFENIIDTLNEKVPELYITFNNDYENIKEFLESNIKIELRNSEISNRYKKENLKRKKKSVNYNREKQEENIKICEEYLKEGKNKKEIAQIMNKTTRTIERYLKKIKEKSAT